MDRPEKLETDGIEYEILADGIMGVKGVPGLICEIGTRRGGSARIIVDSLLHVGDTGRTLVLIDPYGNLDYPMTDTWKTKFDYTNSMKKDAIRDLYVYTHDKDVDLAFFCMEDTEFFKRFADGVPVYNDNKFLVNQYAAVYFDGPHDTESVIKEVDFFAKRTPAGATFIMDDMTHYAHDLVEKHLFSLGFEELRKGKCKATYIKVE
jgi:hypothetical protein